MNSGIPGFTRTAELATHETEDGLIVFNSDTDRVHHLNFTASVLFELCQDTHSAAELTRMMAELYAPEETPIEVVETSLQELVAEGLLVETRAK